LVTFLNEAVGIYLFSVISFWLTEGDIDFRLSDGSVDDRFLIEDSILDSDFVSVLDSNIVLIFESDVDFLLLQVAVLDSDFVSV
jgi:hypothetical protein